MFSIWVPTLYKNFNYNFILFLFFCYLFCFEFLLHRYWNIWENRSDIVPQTTPTGHNTVLQPTHILFFYLKILFILLKWLLEDVKIISINEIVQKFKTVIWINIC